MDSHFFDFRITSVTNVKPATFGEFFNSYYGRLCFFSDCLICDKIAAEHLVRESFVKLWERRKDFLLLENVKSFLYNSVRNTSLDYIRTNPGRKISPKGLLHKGKAHREAKVLKAMIKAETFTEIHAEIEKIPGKRGQLKKLANLKEMTNETIAQLLQVGVSAEEILRARYLLVQKLRFPGNGEK